MKKGEAMLRTSILSFVLVLVFISAYAFGQNIDESKIADETKKIEDDKSEKTDEKMQKDNETKAFEELQALMQKAMSETLSSDERNKLIDLIDKKSNEYYSKYAWQNSKRTKNAIMYRVNVLLYQNRKEDFIAFSKLLLADSKLPDDIRAIIFQERVKTLLATQKYDILLTEIEELIKKTENADTNSKRIDLLSYQNLKLYCYLNLKKEMTDIEKIIKEIYTNVSKIENDSYKFEVKMYVVDTLYDYKKYDAALAHLEEFLKEFIDKKDDDSRYKTVRGLLTKCKILLMKNKPIEEIEKIKQNMENITKDIKSYRMRYRANIYVKELSSFIRFRPGIIAPAFKLKTLDEKTNIDLEQFKGKIIIIGFWATWNAESRIIAKEYYEKWYTEYKKSDVIVISVGIKEHGESVAKQKEYVDENGFKWFFTFDIEGKVANAYGVEEIPQTILIGKDGKVVIVGQKMQAIQSYLNANTIKKNAKNQTRPQTKPSK